MAYDKKFKKRVKKIPTRKTAETFGVSRVALRKAKKRLKITRKKSQHDTPSEMSSKGQSS